MSESGLTRKQRAAERGRSQRRGSGGSYAKRPTKADKAQRGLLRTARKAPLNWRWPVPPNSTIDELRDAVRDARERLGMSPIADDRTTAAFLRHYCSDYDHLVKKVGPYAIARQALRERVAEEIAAVWPELADAARAAGRRESDAMRLSTARTVNQMRSMK